MTKAELKEWITELACSLDRGDLKIDELMNEVEEVVDKNITEQLTLTSVSQLREQLLAYEKSLQPKTWFMSRNEAECRINDFLANNCG